ncbi:MAG TPA: membrane protein insertase YidC [Polyangiaceae bacterium]|nr:membrane protein insertase YidC [Polyangiaceae bacterium]
MEQKGGGISKWLFLGLAIFLFIQYGWPLISGKHAAPERQPLTAVDKLPEGDRGEAKLCTLETPSAGNGNGPRSAIELSSHGASLKSARMLDKQYAVAVDKLDTPIELVTTSRDERMPLRDDLRAPDADDAKQQVATSVLDYDLVASDASSCTFVHKDASSEITKVIKTTARPFELAVSLTVKNLAAEPRTHRLATEQSSWRTNKETTSSFWDLGKKPEWMTDVATHSSVKTEHHRPDAFEPGDFADKGFTSEHWLRAEGDGVWAAVSSNYFTSATIHVSGPSTPHAETLIEEGEFYGQTKADPAYGHLYRARLAYAERELASGESATYETIAFVGPKEREALAAIGGGEPDRYKTSELIDLGFFGAVGKILLRYVYWLHSVVGIWGWTICLLTISLKLLVFPLMLPNIKNGGLMRKLRPQLDEINEKYKDDPAVRMAAVQELQAKAGVPMGRQFMGCLPIILQMPIWFSLYAGLATAVELYHVPFGPLIPDLSHADPYHVIPVILGISSFVQQKLMPPQGVDPSQQKIMLFMMPGILTAMMFFLPAGLGVYMVTNTWFGITQQLLVERYYRSREGDAPKGIEVRDVSAKKSSADRRSDDQKDEDAEEEPALGKRKVRARG